MRSVASSRSGFRGLAMPYQLKHSPAYNIPLSEEDQQKIGLICGTWAQIELATEILIGCLSAIPDQHALRLLLDRKDMGAKVDLLRGLVTREGQFSPRLQRDIRQLCAAISHWGQKRNTAVHGLWTGGEGAGTMGMLRSKMRFMEPSELEELAENLAIVSCHAFHLHWTNFVRVTSDGDSPWRGRLAPLQPAIE